MGNDAPKPLAEFRDALRAGELARATKIVRDGLDHTDAREVIEALFESETSWARGALLAVGKVAFYALDSRDLARAVAEVAGKFGNWRIAAMILRMAGDFEGAAEAFDEHRRYEKLNRRFREACSPMPAYFLPERIPEKCREDFRDALVVGEFLEAAYLAACYPRVYENLRASIEANIKNGKSPQESLAAFEQAHQTHGLTRVDVRAAAILAYRTALVRPEAPIEEEGPSAPSDAELIKEEFGLTEEDLTADS